MSDAELRDAEREAKAGDSEAAYAYLKHATRTGDLQLQIDALWTLAGTLNPGLRSALEAQNAALNYYRQASDSALYRYERRFREERLISATTKQSVQRLAALIGYPQAGHRVVYKNTKHAPGEPDVTDVYSAPDQEGGGPVP